MKNYLEEHLQLDKVHLTPNFDVFDIVAKYCFGWFMKVLKFFPTCEFAETHDRFPLFLTYNEKKTSVKATFIPLSL